MNTKTEQDVKTALQIILETLKQEDVGATRIFAEALVGMALVEGKIADYEKKQWKEDLANEATFSTAIERYCKLANKLKVRSIVKDRRNN